MIDTGRIHRPVGDTARTILFGATADHAIDTELATAVDVDRAHVVMLAERGLVDRTRAKLLLAGIDALRATGFAPLRGQAAPRGLFLLYENHLIETLGMDVGGLLQTARSRNDLGATIFALRLHRAWLALLREGHHLQAILLRRAARFADVVMPIMTHGQAALPGTLGHYLAGVASAFDRDLAALTGAGNVLARSPLGAGAAGGTSVAIDPARTAALLGFEHAADNSLDAVASRDAGLRVLASGAVAGVTLSRLATDLMFWTSSEVAWVTLPDELVGSSSMMPQKRNPFLLEHVKGRAAAPLGAFVAATTSAHATPFTNAIAVGTEATSHVWAAIDRLREACTLARLVVAGMVPQPAAMRARADAGFTTATELANRLQATGQPFRAAHHAVATAVTDAIAHGEPLSFALARQAGLPAIDTSGLDAAAVARASEHGGGPGPRAVAASLARLGELWRARRSLLRRERQRHATAAAALDAAVASL